jgi:hypothetical protein
MWQDFKEIEDTERVEVEKAMENGPWKFQADSSLPGLTTPCVYTVYKNIMSIHINRLITCLSLSVWQLVETTQRNHTAGSQGFDLISAFVAVPFKPNRDQILSEAWPSEEFEQGFN